jgi:tripartite-type tricarboxylate transporter receptor subunit TctC
MKNVIVIAQYSSVDVNKWEDFLRDAKANKELPTGENGKGDSSN